MRRIVIIFNMLILSNLCFAEMQVKNNRDEMIPFILYGDIHQVVASSDKQIPDAFILKNAKEAAQIVDTLQKTFCDVTNVSKVKFWLVVGSEGKLGLKIVNVTGSIESGIEITIDCSIKRPPVNEPNSDSRI